ncbi:uncharacterized protein LOC141748802 [Larus michahellis]|uniref:uncharacterized protein LOC141748802 n=1 Tax=Larus michahellis TaxID=119627 RepID=UPI003D9B3952
MRRREQPRESLGSLGRPDLLRHEEPPLSSLYRSFFEEECRAIVGRLHLGAAAAEPSPGPWECSSPWPDGTGFLTSTPLGASPPLAEGTPARPGAGDCQPAAAPGPARGEPARPPALPRKAARRDAGQQPRATSGPAGRPTTSARSLGRGGSRVSLIGARAGGGAPELPRAGKALGAPGTRPLRSPGTGTKVTEAARPRLQRPKGALQPARPSAIPKATPRGAGRGEAAAKAGSRRESSQRLPRAIPTVASCSRLRPLGKAASPKCFRPGLPVEKLICNRTWELKEDGKADQTWMCVGSSFSSVLTPGPTPGCGDAVPAEQAAGDQLSQELKRVKNELERVKGELADKTAQCEAYRRTISSLQAQLRAAGICPEDAAVEESGDLRRD